MATFNSDVAALQVDGTAKARVNTPQVGGNGVSLECIYTVDGTEVQGDKIRLFALPEGFRPNAPDCSVCNDGVGGTSAIVSIGTAANPDSIASALDITAAGIDRADVSGDEADTPATNDTTQFLFMTLDTLTAAMTVGKKIIVRLPSAKA